MSSTTWKASPMHLAYLRRGRICRALALPRRAPVTTAASSSTAVLCSWMYCRVSTPMRPVIAQLRKPGREVSNIRRWTCRVRVMIRRRDHCSFEQNGSHVLMGVPQSLHPTAACGLSRPCQLADRAWGHQLRVERSPNRQDINKKKPPCFGPHKHMVRG